MLNKAKAKKCDSFYVQLCSHDMSKRADYYESGTMKRTIAELIEGNPTECSQEEARELIPDSNPQTKKKGKGKKAEKQKCYGRVSFQIHYK